MNSLEDHHYRLNKVLLSVAGLWVYENTWFSWTRRVISSVLLVSGIVFQLTIFITTDCTLDFFLKTVPCIVVVSIFFYKFSIFCFKFKSIRKLIDSIRNNWSSLENEDELKIIEQYADRGKLVNIAFASLMYPTVVCFLINQTLETIRNTYSVRNGSISEGFSMQFEYFVNQEEYFYPILIHKHSVVLLGGTTLIGTEITVILFAHHACGLFHLVCYRIHQALDKSLMIESVPENILIIRGRLIDAVRMHKTTLEFCKLLGNTFAASYFILLSLGVASLSLSLIRLSQSMIHSREMLDTLLCVAIVITHFAYVFFANYMGQVIIDSSAHLSISVYDTFWYRAPLSIQKLFLFVMQNSMKNYTFVVGGLLVPSYPGFTTLTKLSLSYFTVIYSTQT